MSAACVPIKYFFIFFGVMVQGFYSWGQLATGLPVYASQVTSIRADVNLKRASCGLTHSTWTDDPLLVGTSIKSSHINEIRASINGIYLSQGLPAPVYTDAIIAGTSMKAIHFQELSTFISSLVCTPTINGICGVANAGSFGNAAAANTAGLCSAGSSVPAALVDPGPWTWMCNGSGPSHTDASCSAALTLTINGVCGGANGGAFFTAAAANAAGLCSAGTPTPAALVDPGPWSWTCIGSGPSHTDAGCSATFTSGLCPVGTSTSGLGVVASGACRCPNTWMTHWDGANCYGGCPSGCFPAGHTGAGFSTGPRTLTWQTTKYPSFSAADASYNCAASNHNCMSCYSSVLSAVVWIRGNRGGPSYFCP